MDLLPFDRCEFLRMNADVRRRGNALEFIYSIEAGAEDIVVPRSGSGERTDGLWKSTCFEAFIASGTEAYIELNFAPSRQWAAYAFTNYRDGMRELDIAPPEISFRENRLVAAVELDAQTGASFNLTAVIEHRNGVRSYWALAHPSGNRPDFHTRDCFVAKLP